MICPKRTCYKRNQKPQFKTLDSRFIKTRNVRRRRIEFTRCGHRITTYEVVAEVEQINKLAVFVRRRLPAKRKQFNKPKGDNTNK